MKETTTPHGLSETAEIPYPLAMRKGGADTTVVSVGDLEIGGPRLHIIAGPCSVENREQILEIAHAVKAAGATGLRGGAYKPRTSPYSFQGHGEEALRWLAEAREATGLFVCTEVMEPGRVGLVSEYADILQIGSRSMQNFPLLKEVAKSTRPVLLKRGMSSTLEELVGAAEYIMAGGNPNVILCERGIRTFAMECRNTFDANAIPALKELTHLPVFADPSHATGKREYVPSISRAAFAAGADGLLVEVHSNPEHALSDGRQSLDVNTFASMMEPLSRIANAVDRTLQ